MEAQDTVGAFLEERCEVAPGGETASSKLFTAWTAFCEDRGERPGIQKTFNDALDKKGFKRGRTKSGAVFYGVKMKEGPPVSGSSLPPASERPGY
jgi:putative DNA primase/helicase